MRHILLLAAALTITGCSSNRSSKQIDAPVQSRTIRVPEAYPTKTVAAQGPEIGSDSQVAGEPSARRTTVRRYTIADPVLPSMQHNGWCSPRPRSHGEQRPSIQGGGTDRPHGLRFLAPSRW